MTKIIFFDVETNGLPLDWRKPVTDVDNWPRITQFAWVKTHLDGVYISHYNRLIKPEGWTIPKEKFFIENGLTDEICTELGVPVIEALHKFTSDLQDATHIVSHNMSFDYNVVGAEMIRAKLKSGNRPAKICTKESTTSFCKIPHANGRGYKWPKLSELHVKLFGKDFEDAHNAMADVLALKDCFFELVKQNVITI